MRFAFVLGLTALMSAATVRASTILASDSATDPAYSSGWGPGTNGGTGFGGAWNFYNESSTAITSTNSNRGWFTGNSINNNQSGDTNSDGDIGSKAWGLYSNSVDNIYAVRAFSSALVPGDTLSVDMDNGLVASGMVDGVRLLTSTSPTPIASSARAFEFRFVGSNTIGAGGTSDYSIVNSLGTSNDTTIPFSTEGIHLSLTMLTSSTYSITMKSLVTGTTVTQTGTFATGSTPIVGFAFKNQQAGSGSSHDAYFNNLVLSVPEPASLGFVAILAVGPMMRQRHRRPVC